MEPWAQAGRPEAAGSLAGELHSRWSVATSAAAVACVLAASVVGLVFHPGTTRASVRTTAARTTGAGAESGAGSALVAPVAGVAGQPTATLAAAPGASGPGAEPFPPSGRTTPTTSVTPTTAVPAADDGIGSPTVTGISPASGPVTGGTWVTISGTELGGVTSARFGTEQATEVQVESPDEVRALSPAHVPGSVEVVVETAAGESSSSPATEFDYTA